jgi:hypothetical protein
LRGPEPFASRIDFEHAAVIVERAIHATTSAAAWRSLLRARRWVLHGAAYLDDLRRRAEGRQLTALALDAYHSETMALDAAALLAQYALLALRVGGLKAFLAGPLYDFQAVLDNLTASLRPLEQGTEGLR